MTGAERGASVHQLLPVLSPGDAIGNSTLRYREMLVALGFRSEIFAEHIDARLAHEAKPASLLTAELEPDDAVIYQLSIGSPLADLFEHCDARRILAYHNITPPEYFAGNRRVARDVSLGLQDLHHLAAIADVVMGCSDYNLRDAIAAGARRSCIVPTAVDVGRLLPRPATPHTPPTILFVGRMAPNKRHDTLLRAVAALRALHVPDARLVMAGSAIDHEGYAAQLRELVMRLGLEDAVDLGGARLSDEQIGDLYACASVFASASEHEGFCVPLIEAMAFEVPVVALATGAIPETAGGAAMLLDTRDPLAWAAALTRVISDQRLRGSMTAEGRRNLERFTLGRVELHLREALELVGMLVVTPQGAAVTSGAGLPEGSS